MRVTTPYQQIKNSAAGRFVRENKLATAAGGVAGSIVLAGASFQSEAVARISQYGVVPLVAGGAAVLGATAVHDAFVNDVGEHNGRAAAKIGFGTLSALGGTEVVGRIYDIPVLDRALSKPLSVAAENGGAIVGAAVLGGAALAGKFAAGEFQKAAASPENRLRHAALGTGGAVASAASALGGAELIGRQYDIPVINRALTGTVEFLAQGRAGAVAGGAALVGAGAVLGNEAVKSFQSGKNDLITAAAGMGAVTAGLGGLELAGHGLGIEGLRGLLTDHGGVVGGTAVTVGGAALARESLESIRANGLTVRNSLGLTAAAGMLPGGVGIALGALGADTTLFAKGAGAGASLGLGLTAVALGKDAVGSFQENRYGVMAAQAVGSSVAATAGLALAGEALQIPALQQLSGRIADATWIPVTEHVLLPTARFLFENPVAGAVGLGAAAAAYVWLRKK